ncbi:MAG: phosphate ABC transporter permease subunit PstC [Micrococcales bacterium]
MAENSNATQVRRKLAVKPFSKGDKLFSRVTTAAANFAFVLVALILFFLFAQSWPALQSQGPAFLYGNLWDNTPGVDTYQLGPMIWGSLLIALLGVLTATPISVATAYLIAFMLPNRLSKVATTLVDLLAALPSVIIGLWGVYVFTPVAQEWAMLLNKYLGWFPLFSVDNIDQGFTSSPFIAGWIVAVMIIPIITSVTREIFSQLDRELINGALALGASRYTVLRRVIIPTSSSGIIGGVLLGLGRAIGETVAIFYVLQLSMDINLFKVLQPQGGAVASWILSRFAEATETEFHALMAAGLVIFIVTLIINMIAGAIVNRSQPWRKA